MPASAFELYADDHPHLAVTAVKRLEAYEYTLLQELMSAFDWGDYKERRGRVLGVETAIGICRELAKELSER